MSNEELLSVAEIVERLVARLHKQADDHEAKMVEHRAAFGARTEADAKIIAGLREELNQVRNSLGIQAAKEANKVLGMVEGEGLRGAAERVVQERDGLLTQVQDMRAEMERLSAQLGWERAEIKRLQWENATMHKDAEDGYAEAIKVLGDPIALSKERDGLRAEVAALQERLRASIARGDFAQMEGVDLKAQLEKLNNSQSKAPKYNVGDKLESYNRSLGLAIPVTVVGVRTVYDCQADGAEYPVGHSEAELKERYSQTPKHPGEPCDPPEATHAEPDLTQLHAKGKEAWSDVPNATQWVEEMRGNTEATHDTEAGKAAAESAVKTDPVADEIKVGDVVEVVSSNGIVTKMSSIALQPGERGIVIRKEMSEFWVKVESERVVSVCDVRKVTT